MNIDDGVFVGATNGEGTNFTAGVKEPYKRLVNELCLLPCFAQQIIQNVTSLETGLSQPCFRVHTNKHDYFAKYLANSGAELVANKLAAEFGIAPKLIYGAGQWLITDFITGELLVDCHLSEDEKLATTLALLAQCHRLTKSSINRQIGQQSSSHNNALTIPYLAIEDTLAQLFQALLPQQPLSTNEQLLLSQLNRLMAIAKPVLQELAQTRTEVGHSNEVFCHGDANFTNVIKLANATKADDELQYQLIDFECACIAPIEYDIAMLMAVNEIESNKIAQVIALYSQHNAQQILRQQSGPLMSKNHADKAVKIVDNLPDMTKNMDNICKHLVTRYYCLSLIINGLWYLLQYQQRNEEKYKKLANKQFLLLANRYPETYIVID